MSAGTQQAIAPGRPLRRQLVMAYSVCRGITRTAAKNFYYAFLVLPRRKREALCAVYAFMRRCDDITDESSLSLPSAARNSTPGSTPCTAPSKAIPPTIPSCSR